MIRFEILGIAAEGRESFAEGCGRIGTTMPTTVQRWQNSAPTRCTGVKYVNGTRAVTCLAEVSGGAAATCRRPSMQGGLPCHREAAHHIALLAKQKGSAWWFQVTGGTEHASPMCWLRSSSAVPRP